MDKKVFYNVETWGLYHKSFSAVLDFVVLEARAFAIVSHFLVALTNTQAFHIIELITAVISFMIQAPGIDVIKHLLLFTDA